MLVFKNSVRSKSFFAFFAPCEKLIRLTRTRQLPHADVGGSCFPLSVHCRSQNEAERVWNILEPIADVVANLAKEDVAAAFLMNVVVRKLFENDPQVTVYAAFLGFNRRPVVYLSW